MANFSDPYIDWEVGELLLKFRSKLLGFHVPVARVEDQENS